MDLVLRKVLQKDLLDNLKAILDDDLMERLNLNIPSEAREKLRRLSAESGKREAELARDLLLRAIEQAEREKVLSDFASAQNPELRERLRTITKAMEILRGEPG